MATYICRHLAKEIILTNMLSLPLSLLGQLSVAAKCVHTILFNRVDALKQVGIYGEEVPQSPTTDQPTEPSVDRSSLRP